MKRNTRNDNAGFSLTELMVVLVIIGVLVLLALPKLLPIVTKAKTTEAKLMLKQVHTLEQSYKFEHDTYTQTLAEIGFEQDKLVPDGGQARYRVEVNLLVPTLPRGNNVANNHYHHHSTTTFNTTSFSPA